MCMPTWRGEELMTQPQRLNTGTSQWDEDIVQNYRRKSLKDK